MNLYQPTISGSLTVSGSVEIIGPFTMSGGSISGTSSFAANAGLLQGLDSTSFVGTGSFNSMSSSVSTRVTKIEGNYATTGSNIFTGAQTVCANITSTGTIIAQTLNVQQVTSSVVYSSGSNIFGCLSTDVQQMTGSLRVSGSNTVLNVGSVAISTDRLCSKLVVETNASPNLSGWITTGTQFAASMAAGYASLNLGAYDNGSTCRYGWIRTAFNDNAAIPADMVLLTGPSERARIISTGITCFACQVCMPRLIVENGAGQASFFRQTDPNSYSSLRLYNDQNSATRSLEIDYFGSTYSTGERAEIFVTGAYPLLFGTNNVCRVSISSTGITSFACQVCAPQVRAIGCEHGLFFQRTTGTSADLYSWSSDSGAAYLYNHTTSCILMLLTEGGCVGIGTNSPNTTLEVRGSGNTAINTTGNLLVASGGTATQGAGQGGQISFGAWLNGDLSRPYPVAMIKGVSECSTTNFNYGALLFGTMDSNTTVQERMRINSSGNVSIATTSSFDVLTVSRNAADNAGGITLYNNNNQGYGSALTFRVNYAGVYNTSRIHGDWGTGNTGQLHFFTANTSQALVERVTINGNGNVLINQTGSLSGVLTSVEMSGNGSSPSTTQASYQIYANHGTQANYIGYLVFNKSRGTTQGSVTSVASGDRLGMVRFNGADGTTQVTAAEIYAEVDGTPGTNDMPGRIVLATTADGASGTTARLTISNAGQVTMSSQPSFKAYIGAPNPTGTKGAWNIIPYTLTEWNVGSCFNTTTDTFTAPVTGKYLFTLQLNVYGLDDTAQLQAAFYINSAAYRYYFLMSNLPTGNTGDTSISVSDILLLSAGDTVQSRVYTDGSGTFYFSNGLAWNSFSGHLLG